LRRRLPYLALAAAVIAADQLTKQAVVSSLAEGGSREILPGVLWLVHARNTGAAFGMLRGTSGVLALVAIAGIGVFASVVGRDPSRSTRIGAALVAAGASGNLMDRIFRGPIGRGGVVDWIDFKYWPAFNVADSAISIGVVVLFLFGMREAVRKDTDEHGAPAREG
jgi:signal peptidase II